MQADTTPILIPVTPASPPAPALRARATLPHSPVDGSIDLKVVTLPAFHVTNGAHVETAKELILHQAPLSKHPKSFFEIAQELATEIRESKLTWSDLEGRAVELFRDRYATSRFRVWFSSVRNSTCTSAVTCLLGRWVIVPLLSFTALSDHGIALITTGLQTAIWWPLFYRLENRALKNGFRPNQESNISRTQDLFRKGSLIAVGEVLWAVAFTTQFVLYTRILGFTYENAQTTGHIACWVLWNAGFLGLKNLSNWIGDRALRTYQSFNAAHRRRLGKSELKSSTPTAHTPHAAPVTNSRTAQNGACQKDSVLPRSTRGHP